MAVRVGSLSDYIIVRKEEYEIKEIIPCCQVA